MERNEKIEYKRCVLGNPSPGILLDRTDLLYGLEPFFLESVDYNK